MNLKYIFSQIMLFTTGAGSLDGQHVAVAMHHIHDVTKPLMTYLLRCDVTLAY